MPTRSAPLLAWLEMTTVRVMPVNGSDSTASTAELPPLDGQPVDRDPDAVAGRAQPVVLSDFELALIDGSDDRTAGRGWPRPADSGEDAGPGGHRASPASAIARGAVIVLLALAAMLIVALGVAAAAR
jgi:hypothetical protein